MATDAKTKPEDSADVAGDPPSDPLKERKSTRKSPKSRTSKTDTSAIDVTDLQSQLARKDDVVAALTERLEQAAEQLDRIRRTGADRGSRSGGGSMPGELVQEQREITEELQRAVRQWEDMQAGAALGRLEMQVTELRDFISGRFDEVSEVGSGGIVRQSAEMPTESDIADEPASPEESASTDDPMSAYEMLKADLMAGESTASKPAPSQTKSTKPENGQPPDPAVAETAVAETAIEQPVVEEIPEAAAPAPIDIAEASLPELQSAVETRDAYISYLIRKLRAAESTPLIAGDWASLESVPDELRASLEHLEKRLQDAHRIAEVENSLERARLARESARLEQLDQQMQKKMKRLGIDDDAEDERKKDDDQQPRKGRSWLKRLGVGRDSDDSK